MSLENENFNVGGMGGAIFGGNGAAGKKPVPPSQRPIGDDYQVKILFPNWFSA